MIASTPCVVALVMISIWPATLFSGVGPRNCSGSGSAVPFPPPARPDAPGRTAGCRGTSAAAPCRAACPALSRCRHGALTLSPAPAPCAAVARRYFLMLSPFPVTTLMSAHIRDQHRQDQQGSDHACLGVAGDVGETHAIAEVQDDEDRQADPDHIARTAENADAAEQHDGDDVELEAGRPCRRAPSRAGRRRAGPPARRRRPTRQTAPSSPASPGRPNSGRPRALLPMT